MQQGRIALANNEKIAFGIEIEALGLKTSAACQFR
jgi:hypothetical protein